MPTTPAILGPARLGNFRLGYVPAALAAVRKTRVTIQLAGVLANARVRVGSLTVHDVLNDAPNTCSLTVGTTAPSVGQDLRVQVNSDAPVLLFNGQLQTVDLSYEGKPTQPVWSCTAIDDTSRANYRRPFGTFTNVSATTVAQSLITQFAPGFTATHVQASLPAISITLDGTEGMSGALGQIAKLIGGYFYFEDLDLHLFQTEATNAPDPIDGTPGRLLDDPPIRVSVDDSQLRTRVYGRGHGEAVLSDVLAGETILPIDDAVMFTPTGGKAIAGTTPEVSPTQVLTYTGLQAGGGGALVGPGAFPSSAPTLALADGTGVETGAHDYAVTFVTAAGESLPGPRASITTGVLAVPVTAPSPGTPQVGAGVDTGNHHYEVTFVTPSGETTPGPISAQVTTGTVSAGPIAAPSSEPALSGPQVGGSLDIGIYKYAFTFLTAEGETTPSPIVTATVSTTSSDRSWNLSGISTGPSQCTGRKLYRSVHDGSQLKFLFTINDNTTTTHGDVQPDANLGANAPTSNTATYQADAHQVPLTAIPIGPVVVTQRKLYRRFNGTGTFKLVTTIANNTATTYTDTTANASLGADAPSSNTTAENRVSLSSLPIGASSVTQRKVYRTAVSSSQLKLLTTIGDNTTTTYADSTADASLGANVPTSDTSGLAQPAGQVNAGSTSLIVAGTGAFSSSGGWAIIGNGQQTIRYTGVTSSSLTEIPVSGPGAIVASVSYNSTVTAAPALTGVTGLTRPMSRGAPVHLWVQRDDLAAQSERIALDAAQGRVSDGIVEGPIIQDDRRGEASLTALCDATLALFSRPLVTVTYATRDTKTKSGKTIVINLSNPPINETLTIQDVTITEIDLAPRLGPKYTVTASTVRFSLEDILRRMAA